MASYTQNKSSKLWSVRFRETTDGKTVQKRLSGYKTKKEAIAAYELYKLNTQAEKPKDEEKILFAVLAEAYLNYEKSRVKESSYYDIERKIRKHIIPYFGKFAVNDIKPINVLGWQETLSEYSYSHRSGLRTYLSSILKYGERYHDTLNVMNKVEPMRNPDIKTDEVHYWTKEQFEKFIDCVDEEAYSVFFRFLYISGCRKGEALALTWSDIDLQNGIVNISKNITKKVAGASYAVTTPKNKSSVRKINIPPSFCVELAEYKSKNKMSEFVFGGERPFPERTIDRRFASACKLAEVPKIRIHDLRHSCASLLISEGVSIVAVSKRLGHKNVEQTLNTYSHMMPNDVTRIIEILDKI